jgi:hypothetical protein
MAAKAQEKDIIALDGDWNLIAFITASEAPLLLLCKDTRSIVYCALSRTIEKYRTIAKMSLRDEYPKLFWENLQS